MKQADLNRAVARATGETVSTIKRLGFLLAELPTDPIDGQPPELDANVIDLDALDARRHVAINGRLASEPVPA